ncbi:zinc-binding protein YacG [Neisseria gonorrhoeae]|uniref:Zinc-binding protein YacG n=1 Tax=Neisseria gonorrhoeae TaxID=485 RepID=A0A378VUJ2_NEIGO|nr:zinc-binding protein YacG [Neisseria gonorrhoeae]
MSDLSTAVVWKPENAFRPFCSQRCKLIDLGGWADGKYTVSGQTESLPEISEPDGHTADRPAFPANTLKGQMPSETNTLQTAFSFSNLIVGICRYLFQ